MYTKQVISKTVYNQKQNQYGTILSMHDLHYSATKKDQNWLAAYLRYLLGY